MAYTKGYKIFEHLVAIENKLDRVVALLKEAKVERSKGSAATREVSQSGCICSHRTKVGGMVLRFPCPVHDVPGFSSMAECNCRELEPLEKWRCPYHGNVSYVR